MAGESTRVLVGLIACATVGGCGRADGAVGVEGLVGAPEPRGASEVVRARQDAEVGINASCNGVLITPRVAATAWHCVQNLSACIGAEACGNDRDDDGDGFVDEGCHFTCVSDDDCGELQFCTAGGTCDWRPCWPYADSESCEAAVSGICRWAPRVGNTVNFFRDGAAWPDDSVNVAAIACVPHPGSRHDGVTAACNTAFAEYDDLRLATGRIDIAFVVLDRRVDAENAAPLDASFPVVPAYAVLDEPPEGWLGRVLRRVAMNAGQHPEPELPPFLRDVAWNAVLVAPQFGLCFEPRGIRGDSGSPVLVGDPEDGPMRTAGVFRGGAFPEDCGAGATDYYTRTSAPGVREWLAPYVTGARDFRGVYLGPADRPVAEDPDRNPAIDNGFDADGDGLDAGHDNCPGDRNPEQFDADGDLIGDACDFCAGRFGGAGDMDGDGAGDDCDLCPKDPPLVPGGAHGDLDDDGIGDECDNCVGRPNPLQENCNIDSELEVRRADEAAGREPRAFAGDMCDTVPCGETRPGAPLTFGVGAVRPVRVGTDRFFVDGRIDHASTLRGGTGMRFCPCELAARDDVASRDLCSDSCALNASEEFARSAVGADEGLGWRWISTRALGGGGFGLRPEPVVAYARGEEGRFVTDATYEQALHPIDVPRWLATPEMDDDYPLDAAQARTLRGVLWTHTTTLTPVLGGAPRPLSGLTLDLATHYWSGDAPAVVSLRVPPACIAPIGPLSADAACTYCGGFFPEIYFGRLGSRPDTGCRDISNLFGVDVGTVTVDVDDLAPLPITDPASFLQVDLGWLAAVEPAEVLGAAGFRYAGLASGNRVRSLVISTSQGFLSIDPEAAKCGPSGCVPPPPADPFATPEEPPALPRTALVLSGFRSTIYAVGGEGEGGPTNLIHAYSAGVQEWHLVPGDERIALGTILAASFSAFHDSIVVLDEIEGARSRRDARLLLIDPDSGRRDVLASFERVTPNDRFSVAVGADGTLFVAGSHGHDVRGAHVVLELDASGGVQGFVTGPGVLMDAPIHASAPGLSVPVTAPRGTDVIGYELAAFRRGRGGPERCF